MPPPATIGLSAPAGPRLAGSLWSAPPGSPGVVVVPGLGSSRGNHADMAETLQASGIAALALDLRGHGDSDGRLDSGAPDDVVAGLTALAERGHAPLGIRGSSMGGLLALHVAARDATGARRRGRLPGPARRPGPAGAGRLAARDRPLRAREPTASPAATGTPPATTRCPGDRPSPWPARRRTRNACASPSAAATAPCSTIPPILAETVAFLAEHLARR